MSDTSIGTYMVELLYETAPQIDAERLWHALRQRCGRVDRLGAKPGFWHFAFLDYPVQYQEGVVPAQAMLAASGGEQRTPSIDQALQQSWSWPAAAQAVASCRSTLLLTELMARGLDYRRRLPLFHHILEAVLSAAPCHAIHWLPTQQLVDPQAYVAARREPDVHPLQFALNVRFYNISNAQPGEKLMDTLGLAPLGLPDLQCHYRDLDPQAVARVLYNAAYYVYDNGDVIEDGHTIEGLAPGDHWFCQHEMALLEPEREVLDLNPGPPYAAGNRAA